MKGRLDNKEVDHKPAVPVVPGAIVFNRVALLAQIKRFIEIGADEEVAAFPVKDLKKIDYLDADKYLNKLK